MMLFHFLKSRTDCKCVCLSRAVRSAYIWLNQAWGIPFELGTTYYYVLAWELLQSVIMLVLCERILKILSLVIKAQLPVICQRCHVWDQKLVIWTVTLQSYLIWKVFLLNKMSQDNGFYWNWPVILILYAWYWACCGLLLFLFVYVHNASVCKCVFHHRPMTLYNNVIGWCFGVIYTLFS